MEEEHSIYHIVTLNDLKTKTVGNYYKPSNFEKDGFIHCTAERATTLLVLEDYFVEVSRSDVILILEIDASKLQSGLKYEPPAPIQGGGTSHIGEGALFPHIYGSLNIDAVAGVGRVVRSGEKFVWPSAFDDIRMYL